MPATKKAPAEAKKPRGKGKAKVTYFAHDQLDLLKRAEQAAKSQKVSFTALVLQGLDKVC